MGKKLIASFALATAASANVAACGNVFEAASCEETLDCPPPPAPASTSTSAPATECKGDCVPLPAEHTGYTTPVLLWVGKESNAEPPACPEGSSDPSYWSLYEGLLDPTPACPACTCSPPACVLPAGVTASSLYMCQDGPPDTRTAFEAPDGWGGECVATPPISPERVGSIAVAPVTERPCAPVAVPPPGDESPNAQRRARLCDLDRNPLQCTGGRPSVCAPSDGEARNGFSTCFSIATGKAAHCPREYPERHEVFEYDDGGSCAPCACVPTASSICEARVSTYEDARCGDEIFSATVGEAGFCGDPGPGDALGSLRATWISNTAGSCTATGGEPTKLREEQGLRTVCCMTKNEPEMPR